MEIIISTETEHEGNDCMIQDVIVMFLVHNKYVVEVIRRYTGWADNGLEFRSRKEFDDYSHARIYYNRLVIFSTL